MLVRWFSNGMHKNTEDRIDVSRHRVAVGHFEKARNERSSFLQCSISTIFDFLQASDLRFTAKQIVAVLRLFIMNMSLSASVSRMMSERGWSDTKNKNKAINERTKWLYLSELFILVQQQYHGEVIHIFKLLLPMMNISLAWHLPPLSKILARLLVMLKHHSPIEGLRKSRACRPIPALTLYPIFFSCFTVHTWSGIYAVRSPRICKYLVFTTYNAL